MKASEYWCHLAMTRPGLKRRLATQAARQLVFRPCRRGLPDPPGESLLPPVRRRVAEALFDACLQELLHAYVTHDRRPLEADSGRLAMLYMRLMCSFNREFEHRLHTGQSLALHDILEDRLVASCLRQWRQFTISRRARRDVVDFLAMDRVAVAYRRYVALTTSPGFRSDVDAQLASIALDSGLYLSQLAELVAAFQRRPAPPELLDDFDAFGIAGKLADDLVDVRTDDSEGRYNLVWAILGDHHEEAFAVRDRLSSGGTLSAAWWTACAPKTTARFMTLFDAQYHRLRSPHLRHACDASMLRVLRPRRPSGSLGTVHVADPPVSAWR